MKKLIGLSMLMVVSLTSCDLWSFKLSEAKAIQFVNDIIYRQNSNQIEVSKFEIDLEDSLVNKVKDEEVGSDLFHFNIKLDLLNQYIHQSISVNTETPYALDTWVYIKDGFYIFATSDSELTKSYVKEDVDDITFENFLAQHNFELNMKAYKDILYSQDILNNIDELYETEIEENVKRKFSVETSGNGSLSLYQKLQVKEATYEVNDTLSITFSNYILSKYYSSNSYTVIDEDNAPISKQTIISQINIKTNFIYDYPDLDKFILAL